LRKEIVVIIVVSEISSAARAAAALGFKAAGEIKLAKSLSVNFDLLRTSCASGLDVCGARSVIASSGND
jgi:hypothetical protein